MAPKPESSPQNILLKNAQTSISEAKGAMSKTEENIKKDKSTKDKRNRAVSAASKIVMQMLDPAAQVAHLLDGVGAMFPPCKVISNALSAIVKIESERRENDARVIALYPQLADTLLILGTLQPAFVKIEALAEQLENYAVAITDTIKDFGTFCQSYYKAIEAKAVLLHLLHSSSNKSKLSDFQERIAAHKSHLTLLLSAQTSLVSASFKQDLSRIDSKLQTLVKFFIGLTDDKESQALDFIQQQGGEENVQNNDYLIEMFAKKFGETLNPHLRAMLKQSAQEILDESQAVFNLQFEYGLKQVSSKLEESREMIMSELRSGPYELLICPDVKEMWKNTRPKESSIKRRQLIDSMSYHFRMQFMRYKAEHGVDQEDAWTNRLTSKVLYHSAIGDAIDEDASGYVSVLEMNDFLRTKPAKWTFPQYLAYWAYGWDVDNLNYQENINKALVQLKKLRDTPGPNKVHVTDYLQRLEDELSLMSCSCYGMPALENDIVVKMEKLRQEWSDKVQEAIKTRLKTLNYAIEYSSVSAIAGSERVEVTILPLLSLLISRHVWLLSKKTEIDGQSYNTAVGSILNLSYVFSDRILELHKVWRRQRVDLNSQFKHYCNGLFEAYYAAHREDYDSEVGDTGIMWSSEDEWDDSDDAPPPSPIEQQPNGQMNRSVPRGQGASGQSDEPGVNQNPVQYRQQPAVEASYGQQRSMPPTQGGHVQQRSMAPAGDHGLQRSMAASYEGLEHQPSDDGDEQVRAMGPADDDYDQQHSMAPEDDDGDEQQRPMTPEDNDDDGQQGYADQDGGYAGGEEYDYNDQRPASGGGDDDDEEDDY